MRERKAVESSCRSLDSRAGRRRPGPCTNYDVGAGRLHTAQGYVTGVGHTMFSLSV